MIMQLILKCKNVSGSVAFAAGDIDNLPAPERHYSIENFQVVLDGPDYIIHHDADELLAQPAGLFRMLTPAEQDELVKQEQADVSVQEAVPAADVVSEPEQKPEDEQQPAPDNQPPALLEKIKKVSSGG